MMIFYDNKGYFLSKKLSLNILLQLRLNNQINLNNQNIAPFSNIKTIPSMKGMFSWLNTQKALRSIGKQKNTQSVNKIPIGEFFKSLVSRAENIKVETVESHKILSPLFLAANAVFSNQNTHLISSDSEMMDKQLFNYGNSMIIPDSKIFRVNRNNKSINTPRNPILIDKENTQKYQSKFKHESPTTLLRNNLLLNSPIISVNSFFLKEIKRGTINNPLIKNYYYSSEHGPSNFVQRGYPHITGSESLHFRDTLHIEQEIEQIKKIVTKTKESVLEKSVPSIAEADIKRYIDINRISDQVYQNLERTIRTERERRGM